MKELICQDWILYDTTYKGVMQRNAITGKEYADIEEVKKEMRVFGTKEQIEEEKKKYNIDEVYDYKIEEKGSYWYEIIKDPVEYNKRIILNLAKYENLYKLNNNKLIILK